MRSDERNKETEKETFKLRSSMQGIRSRCWSISLVSKKKTQKKALKMKFNMIELIRTNGSHDFHYIYTCVIWPELAFAM